MIFWKTKQISTAFLPRIRPGILCRPKGSELCWIFFGRSPHPNRPKGRFFIAGEALTAEEVAALYANIQP